MYFNKYIANANLSGLIILMIWIFCSCSPAKRIPEESYLLSRNRIEITQKSVQEDQVKNYILQKPNKKVLGMRFHLFLYNLSNPDKEKWPHTWLREIGEEPVVFDPALTKNSTSQLKQLLENKGYYHADVHDTVVFKGRNAKAFYQIKPNEPYRVRNISYTFEDTSLVSLILRDTVNSLLGKGMRFDKDILQQERIRIETLLKENGYFRFSKEYIFFDATIKASEYKVDLTIIFKEFIEGQSDPRTKVKQHPKYRIGDVFVYPDFSVLNTGNISGSRQLTFDTTVVQGQYFLTNSKIRLKPNVILNTSYIIPGQYYKLSNVDRTYRNLSEIGLIRYTNITFKERDSVPAPGSDRFLDCRIELTQKKVQSYQPEITGTNSAGDLGISGKLLYQNFNLFKGAEVFNLQFSGAVEALKNQSNNKYGSMKEFSGLSSIVFPKFFSPFRLERFVKKYAPKTSISLSYNYQSRPDYTRSIANISYAYKWSGNAFLTHTVWPIELNYVQIFEGPSSNEFLDSIESTPLGYSFEDHIVNVARYSFELNNQTVGKSKDFIYARFNIESAGNLVNLANRVFNDNQTDSLLFNVPYFQYLLGDIDIRYFNVIDRQNKFAYRLYLGIGYPFGNSTTLPFEKKFYSGGPNSIRGWNTRDLGPGSFVESDSVHSSRFYYPNKSGDIKIEANIEYRFKVIWKMEAAIFLDMGNIWAIRPEADKPGADFDWGRFYKEIAVGTGFGVRFDFSIFLARLDFGIKLCDPALPEGSRWIPVFRDFGLKDLHVKFGVGYPF